MIPKGQPENVVRVTRKMNFGSFRTRTRLYQYYQTREFLRRSKAAATCWHRHLVESAHGCHGVQGEVRVMPEG
jgi:hypothetical protein